MSIIREEGILLEQEFTTKDEVLKALSNLAVDLGISTSNQEVYNAYLKREEVGSTGMVNKFAIPHAKSAAINDAQILFIRNNNDLKDWETLDDSEVNLIISILIPENNNDEHLKLLANVSRKLMNEDNINILKNSKSKQEIIDLISEM